MLFKRPILEGIARGEITLAFRRWKKPTVSPRTRLRTALGEVLIGAVEPIDSGGLSKEQARKAGYESLAALRKDLRDESDRTLYRIEIRGIENDGRVALRNNANIDEAEAVAIGEKLVKWDRANGKSGYHRQILDSVRVNEGAPAGRLAEELGVEKMKFKRDMRKLKELGLTESLVVGYRLSPRGARFLSL